MSGDRLALWLEIDAERDRQDAKWGGIPGVERRDDHTYAAVLGEEFGECCKAWLERDTAQLRVELIQTAAAAGHTKAPPTRPAGLWVSTG